MEIRPLDIKRVTVEDSFWSRETELVRKEVIPYQWEILNDRVPEATPSFCMHNFRAAGLLGKKMRTLGRDFEPPRYTYKGFAVFPDKKEDAKEDEFYNVIDGLDKQCIIVTKDFMTKGVVRTNDIEKLSCPVYRIKKAEGFDKNNMATIRTTVKKLKD